MVSNPDLVFYTCIARATVILAEFSRESNLDDLAFRCIEKAPDHHSMFSHTVKKRVYIFFIKDSFVYFGIFHEDLDKSEVRGFLNRVRGAFEEIIESGSLKGFENFTSYCFQAQFESIFRHVLGSNLNKPSLPLPPPPGMLKGSQIPSLDTSKRKQVPMVSNFSNPSNLMMKKKKRVVGDAVNGDGGKNATMDDTVDVHENMNGFCSKDLTLLMQKNGSHMADRQKAKQIWRKHVWVVLSIDLFVCLILFAIWLWVCRGFQCIDS